MEPLHKYGGRGAIGKNRLLVWPVEYPLSTLELYEDRLILRVWPIRIEIPYTKIDSIEETRSFWVTVLKKNVLKINHHANAFSYLVFWYPLGNKDILNFFKQRGINIIRNSSLDVSKPITLRGQIIYLAKVSLGMVLVGFIVPIIVITAFIIVIALSILISSFLY